MQTQTIEMPVVRRCAVSDCAYNVNAACGARAITVGDDDNPRCDTYFSTEHHVSPPHTRAGIGACKVEACRHNRDYECVTDLVEIGRDQGHAMCVTFLSA